MVSVVLGPGALAAVIIAGAGAAAGYAGAGLSAGLGIAVVLANFVASGWSLAWAAGRSPSTVQGIALGGFAARLIVISAVMVGLEPLSWFSAEAFGLAAIPAFFVILLVESVLVFKGMGSRLTLPGTKGWPGSGDC